MKNLILTIFILVTTISFSQDKKISYISSGKDTLLLPNNELGMRIFTSWFVIKVSERPVILLTSEDLIDDMNRYPIKMEDDIIISENIFDLTMD